MRWIKGGGGEIVTCAGIAVFGIGGPGAPPAACAPRHQQKDPADEAAQGKEHGGDEEERQADDEPQKGAARPAQRRPQRGLDGRPQSADGC